MQTRHEHIRENSARRALAHRALTAFTLIEMLVVLGIIGVLAAISLLVAGHVTQNGRERLTTDLIKSLDTVAASYASQRGKVPATYVDAAGNEFPLIDARGTSGNVAPPADSRTASTDLPEPSLALFTIVAGSTGSASIEDAFKGFDPKLVKRGPVVSSATGFTVKRAQSGTGNATVDADGWTVLDAWGQPIRFVHPTFQGGYGDYFQKQNTGVWAAGAPARPGLVRSLKQGNAPARDYAFRRSARPFAADGTSTGDADEGLCTGTQPYFYSAGKDRDAGTISDNVYTNQPTFPKESQPKP